MRRLGVLGMVFARFPHSVQKKHSGLIDGMVQVVLPAALFSSRGADQRAEFGFEQVGMRRGYYQAVGGREDAAVLRLGLRAARSRPG